MAAMTTTPICFGALVRPSIFSRSCIRPFSAIAPLYAPRSGANLSKEKAAKEKAKKRKKKHTMYKQYDLREAEQFTLCDAMRYALKAELCEMFLTHGYSDIFEPLKWGGRLRCLNTNVTSS
jgi:hypothetical protein